MTHIHTLNRNSAVEPRLLDEQLREALGASYDGLTARPREVDIIFAVVPDSQQIRAAQTVLKNHDPRERSQAQRQAEAHAATLRELRAGDTPLDMTDFAGTAPEIRALARKVLLLETLLQRAETAG